MYSYLATLINTVETNSLHSVAYFFNLGLFCLVHLHTSNDLKILRTECLLHQRQQII